MERSAPDKHSSSANHSALCITSVHSQICFCMLVGVYFAASACVCAVCFVLYSCILPTLPFVQYHRKKSQASLQPYSMEPVAPRSAAQHLSSSSDSKHPDDSQLGDEEVSIKLVKHVLTGPKT